MAASVGEAQDRFDALLAAARPLVLSQQHQRDGVPVEGGRWPVSVALQPDAATVAALDPCVQRALALAGPEHFRTGEGDGAHVTVRALEGYRAQVPADDGAVQRYRAALRAAAGGCGPVLLQVRGLVVTTSAVLACASPVDGSADRFVQALEHALGPDGWYEAEFDRDIWYLSLLHFTGDIADPPGLLDWVDQNRHRDLGLCRLRVAQLVRFEHESAAGRSRMRPVVLSEHVLAATVRGR